jgi:hypothetical protein
MKFSILTEFYTPSAFQQLEQKLQQAVEQGFLSESFMQAVQIRIFRTTDGDRYGLELEDDRFKSELENLDLHLA